jgi:hypothetical protein
MTTNCCTYAALLDAGTACMMAESSNNESVCKAILTQAQALGFCK